MADKYAKGCAVEVAIKMTNEDGETIISKTPTVWYGMSREQGNMAVRNVALAVIKLTEEWEAGRAGLEEAAAAPMQKRQR